MEFDETRKHAEEAGDWKLVEAIDILTEKGTDPQGLIEGLDQFPPHLVPAINRAFIMIYARIAKGEFEFIRMLCMFYYIFSLAEDMERIPQFNQVLMDQGEELGSAEIPEELIH